MKKDARLTIRLPGELKAALLAAAQQRDRKPNWLVVHILAAWLKKHPPKP